jgi:hypothetical protein
MSSNSDRKPLEPLSDTKLDWLKDQYKDDAHLFLSSLSGQILGVLDQAIERINELEARLATQNTLIQGINAKHERHTHEIKPHVIHGHWFQTEPPTEDKSHE